MKQAKKTVTERRNRILNIVKKLGEARVDEISEVLNVSPLTIRRDLQCLEEQSLVERYYGGARYIGYQGNVSLKDEIAQSREKIAQKAATFVEDGDTIFINTSRTALAMLPYIKAKSVIVVTNNGNAINTKHSTEVTIILTGGELRHVKGTMIGEFALDSVNKVIATKAFLGCSGISPELGMTTDILNEVQINSAMFRRSKDCSYILADYTKIGKVSSFISCPIENITNIITDDKADETILNEFLNHGINIIR